ncbi:hypothetical protein MTR67_043698 [Solanum verrucosum]|uniref:Chromo domain-containing protein n=1 Tax=Solanum verrucosum TaxID=315347 RepID=A0AAF0ZUK6_SOLVR|nr:hypothetical protein MTR67_043680 [Solanum verrucosum]WMV50313.1 hypothetical protein MTR67_043698 [Solanum verrucosum]
MVQSRKKSYVAISRRDLEFGVNDWVYLKISTMKGVMRYVHPVFHVPLLKKCVGDLTSVVPLEGFGVKENLSYEEVPVEILEWQVKKLRKKEIASLKVLWTNPLINGATWEAEADMMSRYPHLFPSTPTLA